MQGTGKAKEHYANEVVEGEHLEGRRNLYQAMGQGMSQEKQRNIVPSHGTRKGEGKVEENYAKDVAEAGQSEK